MSLLSSSSKIPTGNSRSFTETSVAGRDATASTPSGRSNLVSADCVAFARFLRHQVAAARPHHVQAAALSCEDPGGVPGSFTRQQFWYIKPLNDIIVSCKGWRSSVEEARRAARDSGGTDALTDTSICSEVAFVDLAIHCLGVHWSSRGPRLAVRR